MIKKVNISGFVDDFNMIFSQKTNQICVKDVTFVVTQNCSLRCSYCYEKRKNPDHDMTFETGKKIVDFLFEEDAKNSELINKNNAKAIILDFIGGEPLLKIDLISQIIDYFLYKAVQLKHRWQYFYCISLTSNGTEYFNFNVQAFLKKYKGRVNCNITVDGNKELHDSCRKFIDGTPSFDKANAAFIDCLEKGYTVNTKITISKENLKFLFLAVKNMYSYKNIQDININTVFEANWNYEDAKIFYIELKKIADYILKNDLYETKSCSLFDELIGQPKKDNDNNNWCGGGAGEMLAFDSNGDIYPCLRFVPFALMFRDSNKYKLGNLKDGILNTKESIQANYELNTLTRKSQSTKECFNCKIASGCAWCSAWNYDLYGTINKRCTNICPMHKARTLANVYYWNSVYIKLNINTRFKNNLSTEESLKIIDKQELNLLNKLEGF